MPKLTFADRTVDITGETLIGRHASCTVVLDDQMVSRRHARIVKMDGLWMIEDCGSAAGTRLNGQRIAEAQPLSDGALIGIGTTDLRYQVGDGTGKARQPSTTLPWLQLVGRTVAGHRIDGLIGRGSIAAVYRAHQPTLQRDVAFKVFDPRYTEGAAARFRAGVGRVGTLSHAGLATLHEAGEEGGLLWCSVELVQGETAAALVKRDGSIAPPMALLLAEKAAEALAAAHAAGVVHGDLRPTTMFVTSDGRVRLTDVGMMPIFDDAELDEAGHPRLAWYTAPEVHSGGNHTPASDVYSLGCVLWHLLVGQAPYQGDTAGDVAQAHAQRPIPSLPGTVRLPTGARARLDALFRQLLAKTPARRPLQVAALSGELRALRAEVEQAASAVKSRPNTRRIKRTREGFPFLGVLLGALVIGGVGYAFWHWRQHPPGPAQVGAGAETAPVVADMPVKLEAASTPSSAPSTAKSPDAKGATDIKGTPLVQLAFKNPMDLQALEVLQGAPQLDGGSLTGVADEAVGVAVGTPLPAGGWGVQAHLTLTEGKGQAVVSVVNDGRSLVQVRWSLNQVVARVGDREQRKPRGPGPSSLQLVHQGANLTVMVDGNVLLTAPAVNAGGQLRFEVAGLTWSLQDIALLKVP